MTWRPSLVLFRCLQTNTASRSSGHGDDTDPQMRRRTAYRRGFDVPAAEKRRHRVLQAGTWHHAQHYMGWNTCKNPIYLITSCWSAITSTTNRWRYTSTASGRLLLSRRRCVWTRSNRGQIGHYTIKPAQTTFKWSCGLVFVVNYHWILRLRIELGRFALKFLHWNYGKLRS